MLTYEELKRINAERKQEYEEFKARHKEIMERLEIREQKLREEYNRLYNTLYGVKVKMSVR